VYSRRDGLHTQVNVGFDEGLKHDSSIHCDELVSLPKTLLTHSLVRCRPPSSWKWIVPWHSRWVSLRRFCT